jgi:hypothetical protein
MVEPARRHGPFDTRYPVRPKLAATTWELHPRDRLERLVGSAFLARFFPNSRRHDLGALAAYESYRNALEQASAAVAVGAHGVLSSTAAPFLSRSPGTQPHAGGTRAPRPAGPGLIDR